MATTVKRLTYDDLESIPQEHEGDRHEIIDGELVVTPSPIPNHVFARKGDEYEAVPLMNDGKIQSRILPGLSLTLTVVFMGISEL